MRIWGITDTGLVRTENQDAYASFEEGKYALAVVCDGMGGVGGGRIASGIAVDAYTAELRSLLRDDMTEEQAAQAMLYSINTANTAIRRAAAEDEENGHMGTTLVSALCTDSVAVICNIGDSRAYHVTAEGIEQISRDHSVVENMVEKGKITVAEARHHPKRNLITRALGPDAVAQADSFILDWQQGEFLLLCTDGLVNTVSDQEILFEIIHGGELNTCLDRLMTLAKIEGAPDNVTAVLLQNL